MAVKPIMVPNRDIEGVLQGVKEVKLQDAVLEFKDCENKKDELFLKLVQFVERKGSQACKGYVEVYNPCNYCDSFIEKKKELGMQVNPCDIWVISVQEGNEKDWLAVMGDDADFTQETIEIYRCQACGKWEVASDC